MIFVSELILNKKKNFLKISSYNVKYFNNKVYYYNNLQLIVYNNGSKKCYRDNNMSKIDINSDLDIRIISKDREKVNEILFPSCIKYDMIFNRELLSISIKDNLKINIYNKFNKNSMNNYEVSIQYLYNLKKKMQRKICYVCQIKDIKQKLC